ncbi:hypothetical protein ACH427_24355 [Streptomyces sp. NPDC020379]|uniref:hypothetical protein n=1 Tax=Streptomyces sp. NPDC020379 TaxID=3365071 RepID=UPI0037AE599A
MPAVGTWASGISGSTNARASSCPAASSPPTTSPAQCPTQAVAGRKSGSGESADVVAGPPWSRPGVDRLSGRASVVVRRPPRRRWVR